jgi:hypothetical protein
LRGEKEDLWLLFVLQQIQSVFYFSPVKTGVKCGRFLLYYTHIHTHTHNYTKYITVPLPTHRSIISQKFNIPSKDICPSSLPKDALTKQNRDHSRSKLSSSKFDSSEITYSDTFSDTRSQAFLLTLTPFFLYHNGIPLMLQSDSSLRLLLFLTL